MGKQTGYQRPAAYDADRLPVRGTPGGWVDCFDDVELTDEIARVRAAQAAAAAQARTLAKRPPAAPATDVEGTPPAPPSRNATEARRRGDGTAMDATFIAEAMALAVELTHNELRAAAAPPLTDAWLQEGLEAIVWERPSAADPEGFVTVGELRDRRAERTGFVLINPATKALRIAWSNDFGN